MLVKHRLASPSAQPPTCSSYQRLFGLVATLCAHLSLEPGNPVPVWHAHSKATNCSLRICSPPKATANVLGYCQACWNCRLKSVKIAPGLSHAYVPIISDNHCQCAQVKLTKRQDPEICSSCPDFVSAPLATSFHLA